MVGSWAKRYPMAAALVVMVAGALFIAACDATGPTTPLLPEEDGAAAPGSAGVVAAQPEDAPEAGVAPGVTVAPVPVDMVALGGGCSGNKVTICHLPPGNPANIQEICISTNAVPAHEAHGDSAPLAFWPDADGDGFGDAAAVAENGCTVPPGYVQNRDDCDDGDAAINPDAVEVCDGVDNDCNGDVDEGGVCVTCPCWTDEDLLAVADGVTQSCDPTSPVVSLDGTDGATGSYERAVANLRRRLCLYSVANQPQIRFAITPAESAVCYDSLAAECTRRGF